MDSILLAAIVGGITAFLTVWGVGAADLANIMSTTIASKAVRIRTAIVIAIVFECAGAVFGGHQVAYTLKHEIINLSLVQNSHIVVQGLLAVSLAGASWMLIASSLGLPVSITNAIVGALVGFGWMMFGFNAVQWDKVGHIAISWVTSPLIAATIAYLIFANIQRLILMRAHPDRYVERYFPIYCFIVGVIFANMMFIKILARFHLASFHFATLLISIVSGTVLAVLGIWLGRHDKNPDPSDRHGAFEYVEKKFSILMAFTACAMVFAHGSNDVPIAVAPFGIIIGTMLHDAHQSVWPHLNHYTLFLGSVGVIIGLLMYGRKVIETVGHRITALTPSRAFAATLAAACTVIVSTSAGIPISATQTLVGGVMGVGLARGIGALNLTVVRNIFMSWVITIPAASALSILYFYIIHNFVVAF